VFVSAVSYVTTRLAVRELLEAGLSRAEVARRLGVSKPTVSYHARRLGGDVDARCARRYDWKAIQRFYDPGHSVRECRESFGFSTQTWHAAVGRGAIVPRPVSMPIAELLQAGVPRSRGHLKLRLIAARLTQNECECCGLADWRNAPLSMALHHRNGRGDDNRLENLQMLCPNCHSQTDNFAGRATRRPHPAASAASGLPQSSSDSGGGTL
jgi:AcrR family transcriptional regulator